MRIELRLLLPFSHNHRVATSIASTKKRDYLNKENASRGELNWGEWVQLPNHFSDFCSQCKLTNKTIHFSSSLISLKRSTIKLSSIPQVLFPINKKTSNTIQSSLNALFWTVTPLTHPNPHTQYHSGKDIKKMCGFYRVLHLAHTNSESQLNLLSMRHNDEEMNHHSVGRMNVPVSQRIRFISFVSSYVLSQVLKSIFFQNDNFTIHIIWVGDNVSTSQKWGDNLFFIFLFWSISKTSK